VAGAAPAATVFNFPRFERSILAVSHFFLDTPGRAGKMNTSTFQHFNVDVFFCRAVQNRPAPQVTAGKMEKGVRNLNRELL